MRSFMVIVASIYIALLLVDLKFSFKIVLAMLHTKNHEMNT